MFDPSSARGAAVAALAIAATACSGGGTHAIEDVRTLAHAPARSPALSSAERFGLEGGPPHGAHGPGDGHDHGGGGAPPVLSWTLPEGWEALPPSRTRQARVMPSET